MGMESGVQGEIQEHTDIFRTRKEIQEYRDIFRHKGRIQVHMHKNRFKNMGINS
jgi:hypothetical protein